MSRRKFLFFTLLILSATAIILGITLLIKSFSSPSYAGLSSMELPDLQAATRLESILHKQNREMFGIPLADYNVDEGEIESGQTFSKLLNGKYNVNIAIINKLIDKCKGKFDLRDLRAGKPYAVFMKDDSTSAVEYMVYEKTRTEFITFSFGDSLYVQSTKRDVATEERYVEGEVESTLYASVGGALANKLAEIYESTIDFTTIQKGDKYRILYEEQFIDTLKIGIGKVYGVEFSNRGKPYIAIRYEQGETVGYWDENGNSMKKAFLRAPLSFKARVSSKFGIRVHPIKRIRQQHNGIDYAAPSAIPASARYHTVGNRQYRRTGRCGNMIWVRHSKGLESGYLHLSRFGNAKVGSRVSKGQTIGYVGSTGRSTGPHLDFRIKVNGKYINPDKLPSTPGDPINAANRNGFNVMKKDVLAVMDEYKGVSKKI